MRKELKTTSGVICCNFEETVTQFKGMIKNFVEKCYRSFNLNYNYINYRREDYEQEGLLVLLECFYNYDIKTKNCFSSYLMKSLTSKYLYLDRYFTSQKRFVKGAMYSLCSEMDFCNLLDSGQLDFYDKYFNNAGEGVEKFLVENLTQEELSYLIIECNTRAIKSGETKGANYYYAVDVFSKYVDPKLVGTLNKSSYLKTHQISRYFLNIEIKKTIAKVENLLSDYLYKNQCC